MAGFLFGGGAASVADLTYYKNVKTYGAVGDGVTDDRAAIQAAVDDTSYPYSSENRGVIWFPGGLTYQVSGPITFELADGVLAIGFLGSPGAKIRGSFADAILKRSANSPASWPCFIKNLRIENGDNAGKGILFHSIVGGTIENCYVAACFGIETYNSQSVTILDSAISPNAKSGGIGIYAGNATSIISTDIAGGTVGIKHFNLGLVVHGGRIETCTTGIVLGGSPGDPNAASTAFDIAGTSMESCGTGIYFANAAGGRACVSPTANSSGIVAGFRLGTVQDTVIEGSSFGSVTGYSHAGVWIDGLGVVRRVSFKSVLAVDGSNVSSWSIATGLDSFTLENCNVDLTVSQLPTAPTLGTILAVTDGTNGLAWGATVTNTGTHTTKYLCGWNGAAWTVVGK